MIGIAKTAMRGLPFAAVLAAVMLIGSVLPVLFLGGFGALFSFLFLVVSSAILGLSLLRKGLREGLQTLIAATVVLAFLSVLIGAGIQQALMMAAVFWLPSVMGAAVLRESVSLDLALSAIAVLTLVGVALVYLFVGDPAAMWHSMLSEWMIRMQEAIDQASEATNSLSQQKPLVSAGDALTGGILPAGTDFGRFVDVMAKMMTGAMAATMLWITIMSVLLARSWQAKLYNPGGFQPEFHRLRAGPLAAAIGSVICVVAVVSGLPVLTSLATVVIAAFLFQGLAVVHALVKIRGMNQGWLIGVYGMLLLLQTSILLGALGIADNWLNIRKL